jgi:hypothetical protein
LPSSAMAVRSSRRLSACEHYAAGVFMEVKSDDKAIS